MPFLPRLMTVFYSNGSSTYKNVTNEMRLKPDFSNPDNPKVHLVYGIDGLNAVKGIEFNFVKDLVIESIFVSTPPTQTDYIEGDMFDTTDMVIKAGYSDFSTQELNTSSLTITPNRALITEDTEITISMPGVPPTTQPISVSFSICDDCGKSRNPKCDCDPCDENEHEKGAVATCTTAQICKKCGQYEFAPALGHTAGAMATCTTAQTCIRCVYIFNPVLGHDETGDPATCTTAKICLRQECDFILEHEHGHTGDEGATCTTAQSCTLCLKELNPALGHSPGAIATCTTSQICIRCDYEYSPANPCKECLCYDCFIDGKCGDYDCPNCYSNNSSDYLYISEINITENYIELHNPTDKTISTKGLFISNDENDLFSWQVPVVIVRPDETVYIKINDTAVGTFFKRMQINFELNEEDLLYLVDATGEILS